LLAAVDMMSIETATPVCHVHRSLAEQAEAKEGIGSWLSGQLASRSLAASFRPIGGVVFVNFV
jgi:hypothetical protein